LIEGYTNLVGSKERYRVLEVKYSERNCLPLNNRVYHWGDWWYAHFDFI